MISRIEYGISLRSFLFGKLLKLVHFKDWISSRFFFSSRESGGQLGKYLSKFIFFLIFIQNMLMHLIKVFGHFFNLKCFTLFLANNLSNYQLFWVFPHFINIILINVFLSFVELAPGSSGKEPPSVQDCFSGLFLPGGSET